jgi:hypothetical protein
MKKHLTFLAAFCVTVTGCGSTTTTRPRPFPEITEIHNTTETVFKKLAQAVTNIDPLRKEFVSPNDKNTKRVADIEKNVQFLEGCHKRRAMPGDYIETLQVDSSLLLEAADRSTGKGDALETVAAVATDLELKANTAANPEDGDPYRVKVIVDTKDSDKKPVQGLEIVYVQKGLHNKPKSFKHFLRRSTPTDEEFVPGNWVLWSQHPGKGNEGDKLDVPVGTGSGKREVKVDLPCP